IAQSQPDQLPASMTIVTPGDSEVLLRVELISEGQNILEFIFAVVTLRRFLAIFEMTLVGGFGNRPLYCPRSQKVDATRSGFVAKHGCPAFWRSLRCHSGSPPAGCCSRGFSRLCDCFAATECECSATRAGSRLDGLLFVQGERCRPPTGPS